MLQGDFPMSEPASPKPKKLLDQLREAIRIKHYSYSTNKPYDHWAKRYILFHNKRHPAEIGSPEIEAFLTHLALDNLMQYLGLFRPAPCPCPCPAL
jgi:hypothetical protein